MPTRQTERLDQLRAIRPRRLALIKPSSLGDIVHALPTLAALRAHWPEASITWVVNENLRSLVEGHPDLDGVIGFDRQRASFGPTAWPYLAQFARTLRAGRFDLAIDLQGLLRSGLMALATGAPIRVGLTSAREGARFCYTDRVVDDRDRTHAIDRLLGVAQAFGADRGPQARLVVEETARGQIADRLGDLPRPRLGLNIGARWLTKRWPPHAFAAIARRAWATRRVAIVLWGAPEDRSLVDELIEHLDGVPYRDLCGRTRLADLAPLAEATDVLISNDTGPLHLAAAAGTRVIGIYTCTDPVRTGPYGPRAESITTDVHCAASYLKRCSSMACMAELTPERVWPLVDRALEAVVPTPTTQADSSASLTRRPA